MAAKVRVLVADSETVILRALERAFAANQYEIASVESAADAMMHIAAESPDIVLLDPALPDGDGRDVIRRIREWSDVPIIVISGAGRSAEKIELLDLGADDFIAKPFDIGELMARMRVARRHHANRRMRSRPKEHLLKVGNIEIDNERRRVIRAGQEVQLTPKEFEILVFLARRAGAVVRHKQMLTAIWGPAHIDDTPYLRVHIAQLRRKIEDNPEDPKIVLNVPGVGYRIAETT